ncbi:MAG: acetate--CoA ligase family protein [Nocardioides sp.]
MSGLHRMLTARSIAVLGASARPGSFGERLAIEALRSSGARRVDLVNPRYDAVQGRACLPSLEHLDHAPDLVLFGVPDRTIPEYLAVASGMGAGGAVVYGTAAGLGDSIRRAAGMMPVCGAGCMGFVNARRGIRALGYLEPDRLVPGGLALITHSGSMFSALLRTHRRLEYATAVSSGQELCTTTGDYLRWMAEQPETRVVGLFLETIRDAAGIRAGLATAAERDLPVVALTVGRSEAGRSMVTAHSGAVAGADAAWEALFATYGAHRCRDVDEFVDTLELFSVGRRPRRRSGGRPGRIATVHDSGAERVLMADVAGDEGLRYAVLGPRTRETLAALLDNGLTVDNPLDIWGRGGDTERLFTASLTAVADDPAVDLVALAVDLVPEYDGDESYPRSVLAAAATTDKPVLLISHVAAAIDQAQAGLIRSAGVPVLEGARSGLRAVSHLLAHSADRFTGPGSGADRPRVVPDRVDLPRWLDAESTLRMLADFGLPVAPTRSVRSLDEAVAAAGEVGYPVVLKTDRPGVEHRTRVDGVRLGLGDEPALRAAYRDLAARLGPAVAVQPDLGETATAELALGVIDDPQVGHVVLVAAGGSRIEELSRRALTLAPVDLAVATGLVIRWRELAGGAAPAHLTDDLIAALVGVGRLLAVAGDRISALDVNPLLVTEDRLVAVDALVQTRRPAGP